MSRTERLLSKLPDCDDVLRRLADVLQAPAACRRRACRREGSCQGGYGPPCYFDRRDFFAEAVRERMPAYRDHWERLRGEMRAALRR